jgi:hypothetical protein
MKKTFNAKSAYAAALALAALSGKPMRQPWNRLRQQRLQLR